MIDMNEENLFNLPYEVLAKVILNNYESFYVIDIETNAYVVYHESELNKTLHLTRNGKDFFKTLPVEAGRVIVEEDLPYVLKKLQKENLIKALKEQKYYSLIYRVKRVNKQVYHQLRAAFEYVNGKTYVFAGIHDIDSTHRLEIEGKKEINFRQHKERQYLNAILDTALAYIDLNVTADKVLEKSSDDRARSKLVKNIPSSKEIPEYSKLKDWFCKHLICRNVETFRIIGDRKNLLESYAHGEKRVSIFFSILREDGNDIPCKGVFYLYQADLTEDVHCLFLLYDLTEKQIRETLEEELKMSRMRNSASQMQPHFLYNALGSIQEVILFDSDYAAKLLEDFTIHLRSCIRAMNNDDPIPFSQELENVRAYVNIEKMRFGDKLKIHYEASAINFCIVPLSIQPLVENSIRHGIYERGNQGGTVNIRSWSDRDNWIIEVDDTGVGFDVDQFRRELLLGKRDSTGLRNIEFRLKQMMNARVTIKSKVGEGTKVTVYIPKGDAKNESDHCR